MAVICHRFKEICSLKGLPHLPRISQFCWKSKCFACKGNMFLLLLGPISLFKSWFIRVVFFSQTIQTSPRGDKFYPGGRRSRSTKRTRRGRGAFLVGWFRLGDFLVFFPKTISSFPIGWCLNSWTKFGTKFGRFLETFGGTLGALLLFGTFFQMGPETWNKQQANASENGWQRKTIRLPFRDAILVSGSVLFLYFFRRDIREKEILCKGWKDEWQNHFFKKNSFFFGIWSTWNQQI